MRKLLIPALSVLFLLVAFDAMAATCEVKSVCIDSSHVGIQGTDCKITSADEIAKAMGGADGTYACYIGCKDGACIGDKTPYTCTDTDGGTDYFVKGSVAVKGNGEQSSSADSCTDKDNLLEAKCSKEASGKYLIQMAPYKCPNGCVNGACVKSSASGSPTGSTCVDSDGGKNIFKAGVISINGVKQQNIFDICEFEPQEIDEAFCLPDGTYSSEEMQCPGLCKTGVDGSYCTSSCEKSDGYYCHKTPDGKYGIAFLTKDCKWEKGTACQSNSCSTGFCMTAGNLIDTDGDGLLDANEKIWGTDPNKFDTDGDGYGDMTEISGGFNPIGEGKFTSAQVILAGQMAPVTNDSSSTADLSSSTPSTTATDIKSSTTTDLITSTINSVMSDFGWYILGAILIIFILLYIYSALCLQLIAKKLGLSGAWMAWVPIANNFLTFKCAGRPYWWFWLLFVPIVNIIAVLVPWMDIAEKLGKPKWLGALIILGPLSLIIMGYLAFSRSESFNNPDSYVQPLT